MPLFDAFTPFKSLGNPVFARLYAARTTSLLGEAPTWVGLALLAFELGGHSAQTLAFALTLRVTAFVLLSPLAGVLADCLNRKTIMVTADMVCMVIISPLPFVTDVGQSSTGLSGHLLRFRLTLLNNWIAPHFLMHS